MIITMSWSLAKCACPSWSSIADESALRSALASLDDYSSSLYWWLGFWTFIVALGVVLEVVYVVGEYLEELHDFKRGTIHPPERPSTTLFVLGLLGAGLVAAGVSGELWKESQIAKLETCIRKGNDALFLMLSNEAGDAATAAEVAHDEADAVKEEADAIGKRLEIARNGLSDLEQKVRVQGPRDLSLQAGKDIFVQALKPFAGQKIRIMHCGLKPTLAEIGRLEQVLVDFLGPNGANWIPEISGWPECPTSTPIEGNFLGFNPTNQQVNKGAKALQDVLNNKLAITTTIIGGGRIWAGRMVSGPGSPKELSFKDETKVFLLIGSNPMFDINEQGRRTSGKKK